MTHQVSTGAGTLERGARLVAGARQDFDRLAAELEGQVAGLHGRWAGAGGQAFFALHRAWTERQRVVVGALDGFEAALTGTGRDLTATDDAQASQFATFTHRLG